MAASILHFGQDLPDRFPVLRNQGYSVKRFEKLVEFRQALQTECKYDAVSMSDVGGDATQFAFLAARTYSPAPLILFRTQNVIPFPLGEGASAGIQDFDLVVPATASSRWMVDIHGVIARSNRLRIETQRILEAAQRTGEEFVRLRQQAAATVEESRLERAALASVWGLPIDFATTSFIDRVLRCTKCGEDFVFSAGEQLFFQQRHFVNDPKYCRQCRATRARGVSSVRVESPAVCTECGTPTIVPFKPVNGRPVLCRACFDKRRASS